MTETKETLARVGRFTIYADGTLEGPAEYMKERYSEMEARIVAGDSAVYNYGAAHIGEEGFAESVYVAYLVAVQTDYAGWHGSKVFFDRAERGLVPETGLPA